VRKILTVIFLLAFCVFPLIAAETGTSTSAQATTPVQTAPPAQQVQSADNIISANVWPYLGGFFNLGYERKILDILSVRIRGLYWSLFSTITNGTSNFMGCGLDVYFYPQGKACRGWFLGPRLDMLYIGNSSGNLQIYTAGGQVGYKWVNDGGFEMALALGATANISNKVSTGYTDTEIGVLKGALPTFDFDLGWAF
jgi:hypothetical protein